MTIGSSAERVADKADAADHITVLALADFQEGKTSWIFHNISGPLEVPIAGPYRDIDMLACMNAFLNPQTGQCQQAAK